MKYPSDDKAQKARVRAIWLRLSSLADSSGEEELLFQLTTVSAESGVAIKHSQAKHSPPKYLEKRRKKILRNMDEYELIFFTLYAAFNVAMPPSSFLGISKGQTNADMQPSYARIETNIMVLCFVDIFFCLIQFIDITLYLVFLVVGFRLSLIVL